MDLTSLDDHRDIRADENGVWLRKGAPVAFISIISSNPDEKPEVFRRSKMGALTNHYKVSRTYYQHSNSPDFHRIITVTYGNEKISHFNCPIVSYPMDALFRMFSRPGLLY